MPFPLPLTEETVEEWGKKCRLLAANKRSYADESERIITKQRKALEKIKADNLQLKDELKPFQQVSGIGSVQPEQQRMIKLQRTIEGFQKKIAVERRNMELVEKELDICQVKVIETQRVVSGGLTAMDSNKLTKRHLALMENRHDQIIQRLNEAVARNKDIRQQVEASSKENTLFEQLHNKLEKQVATKNKQLQDLEIGIRAANDLRRQTLNAISSLRLQGEREETSHDTEMRELEQQLVYVHSLLSSLLHNSVSPIPDGCLHGSPTVRTDTAVLVERLRSLVPEAQGPHNMIKHLAGLEAINLRLFCDCSEDDRRVRHMNRAIHALQAEVKELESRQESSRESSAVRQLGLRAQHTRKQIAALKGKIDQVDKKLVLTRSTLCSICTRLLCTTEVGIAPKHSAEPDSSMLSTLESYARALLSVYFTIQGQQTAMTC